MARLINIITGDEIKLLPVHLFGRLPETCNSVFIHHYISRLHATISWDGFNWLLKDSSINGTYIDRELVQGPTLHTLSLKNQLQFGSLDADPWQVVCLAPPVTMLVPLQPNSPYIELEKIIALPSEQEPSVVISEIAPGEWLCESEMGQALLKSGDLVGSANNIWRFIIATPFQSTVIEPLEPRDTGAEAHLHFQVSQDEEHVHLKIHLGQNVFDFYERSHHYVLLLLARKYMEDTDTQCTELERGWIDKELLCRQMGVDLSHLNILIFRFRKQVINTLPSQVQNQPLIQTRVGQVRLYCAHISIAGGLPQKVTNP